MEGQTDPRVQKVIARTKKLRRQREQHLRTGLSALCLALTLSLARMYGAIAQEIPSIGAATDDFGAMLLHDGAGGYVLVGVLAFAVGTLITVACLRWRKRH